MIHTTNCDKNKKVIFHARKKASFATIAIFSMKVQTSRTIITGEKFVHCSDKRICEIMRKKLKF